MDDYSPFPTLPVSWYVEPDILELERETVLATAPDYVGVTSLVPENGCYYTVPLLDHAEILVRDGDYLRLLSNVCRHRGSLMLNGCGQSKAITCPMHAWSYNFAGTLLSAPHYHEMPCVHLESRLVQEWHGLLFAGPCNVADDLAPLQGRPELDISHYTLVKSETVEQPVNWKIPIEVLLENYHAPYIHPGFTRFADPRTWYDSDGTYDNEKLMYQEMKPHPKFSRNPASPTFERWQKAILQANDGRAPQFGALVALYFPNIIIEWWPFMFVVTVYVPRTPEQTLMTRQFFVDLPVFGTVSQYMNLAIAAWYETQRADDTAHEALHKGRLAQYRRDAKSLAGYDVYQSPMETSVELFHRMLMRTLPR